MTYMKSIWRKCH